LLSQDRSGLDPHRCRGRQPAGTISPRSRAPCGSAPAARSACDATASLDRFPWWSLPHSHGRRCNEDLGRGPSLRACRRWSTDTRKTSHTAAEALSF